jgi:Tol biopolymer transport system component
MTTGPDGQTAGLARLTTSNANDSSPAISPDGKRIAFTSKRDGDWDVQLMKASPEGPRNVPVKLTKKAVNDPAPDWSPDCSPDARSSSSTATGAANPGSIV